MGPTARDLCGRFATSAGGRRNSCVIRQFFAPPCFCVGAETRVDQNYRSRRMGAQPFSDVVGPESHAGGDPVMRDDVAATEP
jgi:hypothetical protein